jgi:hypothetical protein
MQQGVDGAALEEENEAPAADAAASLAGAHSKRRRHAARSQDAVEGAAAAPVPAVLGPSQGFLSFTSVGSAVEALCRSAARRLRGLRLCADGAEDGVVTHLVIGSERRTLKAMLALANGAWLVSPEWVTASLEAGRWLPEGRFPAAAPRFVAAAARARALLEDPDAAPLLGGRAVHVAAGRGRRGAASAASLRRMAAALGADVAAAKSCEVCVVAGAGDGAASRPAGLPHGANVVREEWLLRAAEQFEAQPLGDFVVA